MILPVWAILVIFSYFGCFRLFWLFWVVLAVLYYDRGSVLFYPLGTPPPPPSKSDKTLYTDIYLPTIREGTHFIIKVVVLCLGALTGPREFCQILRRGPQSVF